MNTDAEDGTFSHAREEESLPRKPAFSVFAFVVRMLARVWVVILLLTAAAFTGVTVTQVFQQRAELERLQSEPGPNAYAVLAYRAELERQIEAISSDRRLDAVPTPPPRPALMEEIDMARARNRTIGQGGTGGDAPRRTRPD